MINYKTEFPRFTDPFPEIEGFIDTSWHNDACPSLGKELRPNDWLHLFVNFSDPDKREIGLCKYSVHFNVDGEENQFLLETDDLDEAKTFIQQFLKEFQQ